MRILNELGPNRVHHTLILLHTLQETRHILNQISLSSLQYDTIVNALTRTTVNQISSPSHLIALLFTAL